MVDRPDGVSFVVPVHNKAPYLARVLDAIRAQRGTFAREYIFVDDGSTDRSLELVRELTTDWPDTTILAQENRGSAHATNRGIERARYAFIKFVDADDLLVHDATAVLRAALGAGSACLAFGRAVAYDAAETPDLDSPLPRANEADIANPLRAALKNSLFNPSQMMARTACVLAVGGCDERVVHSQEYSLTLRLARNWPFARIDVPVTYRPRDVPGSLGSHNGRQLRRVTMACAHFLRDHPGLPADIARFAVRRCAARAWKFARRERGAGHLSRAFMLSLAATFGVVRDGAAHIEACARAFDEPRPAAPRGVRAGVRP
ncbi:MAG: glycosyltransferase family 2 protein [Alphaproteobacteria bacterium]